MKAIMNYIRKEEWSPYVAGVLLGIGGHRCRSGQPTACWALRAHLKIWPA